MLNLHGTQPRIQKPNLRIQIFCFQAPAIDVVAVGHASGIIVLHNLKFDESIVTLSQDWGPIASLAFRSDGHPILAAGSSHGHIGVWDLSERRLASQIRNAHSHAVHGLTFLPNEPVLISSSADNTIKVCLVFVWFLFGCHLRGRKQDLI